MSSEESIPCNSGCSDWLDSSNMQAVSPLEQSYIAVSVVSLFWASDRQQSFLCVPATLSYLSDYQFSNRHKTNEMERPPCLSSLLILIRQNKQNHHILVETGEWEVSSQLCQHSELRLRVVWSPLCGIFSKVDSLLRLLLLQLLLQFYK